MIFVKLDCVSLEMNLIVEKKINETMNQTKYTEWVKDFTQSVSGLGALVVNFSNISKSLGTVTELKDKEGKRLKSKFELSEKLEATNVTELKNDMDTAFKLLRNKLNKTNDSLTKFMKSNLKLGSLRHGETTDFHKALGYAGFLKQKETTVDKYGTHLGLKKNYELISTQSINKKSNVCQQFTKLCELCCELEDHVSLWLRAVKKLNTVNQSKADALDEKINKLESERDQKKEKQQKLQEQIKDQVPPGFSTNKTENRMSTVDQILKSRIKPEKKSKFAQRERTEKLGGEQLSDGPEKLKLQIKNKQKDIKDTMKQIEKVRKSAAEAEENIKKLYFHTNMYDNNLALLTIIENNSDWNIQDKFILDTNVQAFLMLLLNYNNNNNNKLIKKEKLKKFISNKCINICENMYLGGNTTKFNIIRQVKNSVLNIIPNNANVRLTDVENLLNLHFKKIDLMFKINKGDISFFKDSVGGALNKEYCTLTLEIEKAEKELVKKPPWIVNNNTLEKIKNLLNLPKSVINTKEVTVDELSKKYDETFKYIKKQQEKSQTDYRFNNFGDDEYWEDKLSPLQDKLETLNNELAGLKKLLYWKAYEVDTKPLERKQRVKYNLESKRFKRGEKTLENLKINLSKLENRINKCWERKKEYEGKIINIEKLFVWP